MPQSSRVGGRVFGAAVLGALYLLFIRPSLLRWGASDDEVRRECPGDWVVPDPHTVRTRAVTIRARSDQIWPWLAQMGAGRGGRYSYDWLDRLFGYTDAPSSDDILPQFQSLAVGDVIPLGNGPSWPVIVADRNEPLVVEPVTGGVSWAWILEVVAASTTRLISRVRLGLGHKPLLLALAPAVDLPWFLMERKMLHGIKRRA
jgi:hypothetical protein